MSQPSPAISVADLRKHYQVPEREAGLLASVRSQTYHPDAFTAFGIDPAKKALIVVKSTQHFYAGFAPLAKEIRYVTTPGAIPPDFANIAFTKLARPYWPRVEDPFAGTNQP